MQTHQVYMYIHVRTCTILAHIMTSMHAYKRVHTHTHTHTHTRTHKHTHTKKKNTHTSTHTVTIIWFHAAQSATTFTTGRSGTHSVGGAVMSWTHIHVHTTSVFTLPLINISYSLLWKVRFMAPFQVQQQLIFLTAYVVLLCNWRGCYTYGAFQQHRIKDVGGSTSSCIPFKEHDPTHTL